MKREVVVEDFCFQKFAIHFPYLNLRKFVEVGGNNNNNNNVLWSELCDKLCHW